MESPVLLKNSNLFYFNDLCKLPESLLRFDITAIIKGMDKLKRKTVLERKKYNDTITVTGAETVS